MMDDVKMTLSIKSKYRMSSWDNCCDDVGAINTSPSQLLLWYRGCYCKRGYVNQKVDMAVKENAAGKVRAQRASVSEALLMLVFGCSSRHHREVVAEQQSGIGNTQHTPREFSTLEQRHSGGNIIEKVSF